MAIVDELSDSESILVNGARGKSLKFSLKILGLSIFVYLVGHIKEDEEVLLLANGGELLPLFWKRIDTSRVVSTSMQ